MGSGGLGFTIGQRKTTDNDDGTSLIHSGSSVTSKGGDIRMTAGGHYRQSGSDIAAGGDADVRARSIDISAVNDRYSNQHIHTYEQKGLTVSLDIGPLQAAQNLYQSARTIGQSRHGRTNAMAAANTGWQAYQLVDGYKGGRLLDTSNLSLSVGYGQQKNRSEVRSDLSRVQESSINAGGKTRLHATGAGQASNITVTGSDIQGAGGTLLAADNRILLQSATFGQNEESRHQSSGWNVGATARYDGKPKIGISVGGQTGHGNGHGAGESHRHSHIGNKGSQTILQSGGDTTLRGAQVAGKGIRADVQNLSIESVQDTAAYQGRQKSGGAQISAGYGGVGINGHYSQSQLDADHRSVSEQSGLYAGDDGYQIHVRAHTELNGGLITSSQSAEDNGKNHFSTGTLGFGDLHNHSHYQGESLGMDAGVSRSNKTQGQKSDAQPDDKNRLSNTAGKNGTSHGIGYGNDSDRQESITHSGINTRNLQITDEASQIRQTGLTAEETRAQVSTGTTTESAQADAGSLHNRFDKERVENEINLQRNVSQNFGHNVQQANGEINHHLDHLKEQLQQGKISQAEYDRQMALWQRGQVLLNSIASGLSAPTQSGAGIAANAVSPAVSYQIGQYFKELAANNRDGQLSAGQEAAHILAHTVWGAAVAHAGGNNALAGALAAGGPEVAAPIISHYLYQERDGSRLSAEQKETVTAIAGLIGTAAGAALGNTSADAAQGSLNAKNAVENNSLLPVVAERYMQRIKRLSQIANSVQARREISIVAAEMRSDSQKYSNMLRNAYQRDISNAEKNQVNYLLNQLTEARNFYDNAANESIKNRDYISANFYNELKQDSIKDYTMLKGFLNATRKNYPSASASTTSNVVFKSSNGRVWNDGREAAGLGQPVPDYIAIQAAATTVYIPLYGKPHIYIGASLARDGKFKPSYGVSVRFGEIQTRDDDELVRAGVYHPSTKWQPDKRAEEINRFLPGVSGSAGGCVAYLCINRISTLPTSESEKSQTAYEYGIGVGFGGVSPYSFNFEGGRTQSMDKLIEEIKNSGNTEKAPSR